MALPTQLVTRDEILQRTPLGGNIDQDKIVPHIITAQDIELQTVLGTNLYNAVLGGSYPSLLDTLIKPMLCHYIAANFYLFHAFDVGNGGIYRHQSENSFTPSLSEIDRLHMEQKAKAVHYRTRLVDHLCYDSSQYPEYISNTEDGMYPRRDTPPNQLYLG